MDTHQPSPLLALLRKHEKKINEKGLALVIDEVLSPRKDDARLEHEFLHPEHAHKARVQRAKR